MDKGKKITVCGLGYVGMVTALSFANRGLNVCGYDINKEKINSLSEGIAVIHEPGIEELMKKGVQMQKITYTNDFGEALEDTDVLFIAVNTPNDEKGEASLDNIYNILDKVITRMKKDLVVVIKSTVPPGTCRKLKELYKNPNSQFELFFASNPEFLAQGRAVKDALFPSRIVLGCDEKKAERKLLEIYEKYEAPKLIMRSESAELVKYAANSYLAIRLSYINEIANICSYVNADISDVIMGLMYDPRIGKEYLAPGIGYGGSCLPKDTKAILNHVTKLGYQFEMVKAAIKINEKQTIELYRKVKEMHDNLNGMQIAVLGLSFKAETDDIREAPAIKNIELLLEQGAIIKVYDPVCMNKVKDIFGSKVTYEDNIKGALQDAEICMIFTEWKEIKNMCPEDFMIMKRLNVYDGRHMFEERKMKKMGIDYHYIGETVM